MIYCLITRQHAYTIQEFLQTWGRRLVLRFRFVYYDELVRWHEVPVGTYLFTDLERLSPPQMALARHVAGRLETSTDPTRRIVNDPRRVLLRYDLLRALNDRGINDFRPWRLDELDTPGASPRYPVFLRREDEHTGSLSELLHDRGALDAAVGTALAAGAPRHQLLAVEYCETSDPSGAFWKYAAFRIGDHVFPHHLLQRSQWVAKDPSDLTSERFERENSFISQRPHDEAIRKIFDIAGIDYGRIDYSTADGSQEGPPVVWEINTNPSVLLAPDLVADDRLLSRAQVARWLLEAFEALDTAPLYARPSSYVPLCVPPAMAGGLGHGPVRRGRDRALRMLKHATRSPVIRPLARRIGRFLPRQPAPERLDVPMP